MRIGSSNIGMESTRRYHSLTARRASVTILAGNAGLRMNPGAEDGTEKKSIMGEDAWQEFYGKDPYADKKKELKEKLNEMNSRSGVRKLSYVQGERDALSTVRDRCMQYLFGIFFGETKKWDFMELTEITEKAHTSSITINPEMLQTITYRQETYMEEKEDTDFSAGGVVRTADGRTIEFNINVQMSRSFQAYYGEQFQRVERQLVDPLVINLDGNVAEVKDQTFFFDLDADGVEEEISMLGSGSGYLALDKNGDGIINDGSELFGTKSGNGFADLAAYDSDGNGRMRTVRTDVIRWRRKISERSAWRIRKQILRWPQKITCQMEEYAKRAYFYMRTDMQERYSMWIWLYMNKEKSKEAGVLTRRDKRSHSIKRIPIHTIV